jgi:FlaA1/EpsC-like NDP-sugar epimerase
VFADAASFVLAIFAAYLLRFEFVLTAPHLNEITRIIFWLVPLKLSIFYAFGLYKGMWRYFSLHDVWFVALATSLSSLLTVDIVFYVYLFEGFSRSVFFLDAIVTFIITGGYRVLIRALYRFDFDSIGHPITRFARHIKTKAPKRVLIIGAGSFR